MGEVGLALLLADLHGLREQHDLDAVSGSRLLPDGVVMTVTARRGHITLMERNGVELRVSPEDAR